MTLSAGSRLGPYEILSPVGAGGMGEVYRAKDPRLGRETGKRELIRELMPSDAAGVTAVGPVHVLPDGKSWVFGYSRILSDLHVVDGLK